MSNHSQRGYLLQRDYRALIETLGTKPWITVYSSTNTATEDSGFFCALIPNAKVQDALAQRTWDLSIGNGMPGFSIIHEAGAEAVEYDRFGHRDGIEPLVIERSFHGIKDPYVEILEEFRLFHNLYYESQRNEYLKFDDDGDEDIIVTIEPQATKMRLREIRQFLAAREMHLAVYFDVARYSTLPIDELSPSEREEEFKDGLVRYSFHALPCEASRGEYRSFSRLLGKKLIPPLPQEKSGVWPHSNKQKEFEEFIIRLDDSGDPVTYSCNPEGLANSFGANPHAPNYLTPVFFRRPVLQKYYGNPARYSVEDNYLRCAELWGLRMDNNHPDYVIVFLGDLGQDLSHREQLYWKNFNVPPEGKISPVTFKRSILAEFADPERPDLLFKSAFESFQREWLARRGWALFKPLTKDDEHFYRALRIPLTNDQAEFDSQVQAITKVMIESLNEAEIEKATGPPPPKTAGIGKFELFLKIEGLPETNRYVKFLRDLQDLRSGVGHRKGPKYGNALIALGIHSRDLRVGFEKILRETVNFLGALSNHIIS